MAMNDFLAGVIEGFYGQPWAQSERLELFEWMSRWGLNTYLYAPKDDLKHRAIWRDLYTAAEENGLRELIDACRKRNIQFYYAISPGLDIRYGDEADLECLRKRIVQMLNLGCHRFALFFDDIPERPLTAETSEWGSLAGAQCHVTNSVFNWALARSAETRFLFCPTAYCGWMAERNVGGAGYLETIGQQLLSEINVFWTGPEIISREITVDHINEVQKVLGRKPLIWDNLHANDYDGRRFYCGPYAGRSPDLKQIVRGVLSNPNNEFPLNFVPIRTLAQFVHCDGHWDPRAAYLAALREWADRFATVAEPIEWQDLEFLGDCYYLPHEEGATAQSFYEYARALLSCQPVEWGDRVMAFRQQAARLRQLSVRLTELRDRGLFYALSRRIWDLREEVELLDRFVAFKSVPENFDKPFQSDYHLADTYRGGIVSRLQRLLIQQPDGAFEANHERLHDSARALGR
jgi:protein O-GlcNAcase / histone acetyltransferase